MSNKDQKSDNIELVMHPEGANAYFANSYSVEVSDDDVTIGFGQTVPSGDKKVREIRRRIALTHKGLRVIAKLLNDAVAQLDKKSSQN